VASGGNINNLSNAVVSGHTPMETRARLFALEMVGILQNNGAKLDEPFIIEAGSVLRS
jgi:hypothetical protein